VQQAGFETHSLPEISSYDFRNDRGFKWLTEEYFSRNLDAENKIIDKINPDAVVFDFRFTTALSARIKGKRSIGILHGNALSLALDTKKCAKNIISGNDTYTPGLSLRNKIVQFLFPQVFSLILRKIAHRINPLLKAHGNRTITNPFALLFGDENIVADIPELIMTKLPDHCHLVGPLLWTGWEKKDSISFEEPDSRPIVYVTMGSTVEAQPVLHKVIESLANTPYTIFISKGRLELTIRALPHNIHLHSMLPGKTMAQKSALVIHHGGHETLMQALSAGTPSLIIPTNPDQILVANQAQRLGTGRCLRRKNSFPMDKNPLDGISATVIRNTMEEVIQDKHCRSVCEEMKNKIKHYVNSQLFVPIIVSG
jgi:UDP:flavonoid glycosyltransferase YjiC (YdhE family)